MVEYAVRRKLGSTLRVDNLTEDRVEGYWNMRDQSWFPLDWLDAGRDGVGGAAAVDRLRAAPGGRRDGGAPLR